MAPVPNLVNLPAGSVVEIQGGAFEAQGALRGMGTADKPIFIRGAPDNPPLFVDPIHGDFHVTPDSPAVDSGSSLSDHHAQLYFNRYGQSHAFDRDGDPRPTHGTEWDTGPDEYTPLIFAGGFESGTTDEWSSTTG